MFKYNLGSMAGQNLPNIPSIFASEMFSNSTVKFVHAADILKDSASQDPDACDWNHQ